MIKKIRLQEVSGFFSSYVANSITNNQLITFLMSKK